MHGSVKVSQEIHQPKDGKNPRGIKAILCLHQRPQLIKQLPLGQVCAKCALNQSIKAIHTPAKRLILTVGQSTCRDNAFK